MGVSNSAEKELGGSGAIFRAVELLANPEELRARMEALAAAEASANEALRAVGPANEILALRKEAEDLLVAAKKERHAATEEARSIVVLATDQANKIRRDANAQAEDTRATAVDLVSKAEARLEDAEERSERLDERAEAITAKETEVAGKSQALDVERGRLFEERKALAAEKQKIAGIMAKLKEGLA
jgi:hypothetical protein